MYPKSQLRKQRGEGGRGVYLRGGFDVCLVAHGLGAVFAVFGAAAGLDGEEGALLDFLGVPVHAMDGCGLIEELDEWLVVQGLDLRASPVLILREGVEEGGKEAIVNL